MTTIQRYGRPRTIQKDIEVVLHTQRVSRGRWTPHEVWLRLQQEEGTQHHTLAHVHAAMARLRDRGVIDRLAFGVYALAGNKEPKMGEHFVEEREAEIAKLRGAIEQASQELLSLHSRYTVGAENAVRVVGLLHEDTYRIGEQLREALG